MGTVLIRLVRGTDAKDWSIDYLFLVCSGGNIVIRLEVVRQPTQALWNAIGRFCLKYSAVIFHELSYY